MRLGRGWSRQAREGWNWIGALVPGLPSAPWRQCYPGWYTSYRIFNFVVILLRILPAPSHGSFAGNGPGPLQKQNKSFFSSKLQEAE